MKILVIAQDIRPVDGWGTIARNTLNGLRENGHDVFLLAHDTSGADIESAMDTLPLANAMLGSPLTVCKAALSVRKAVKTFQPDVIHFAVEPYALCMPLLKLFCALPPWVVVMLGTYTIQPLYLRHTKLLMRKLYEQCAHFLVCSNYTKTRYLSAVKEVCGEDLARQVEDRTTLFRLGIADSLSGPASGSSDTKRILFVGGVKPRKGVLDLMHALAAYKLMASRPFHADIIGSLNPKSDYTHRIQAEIECTGIPVILHGHVDRNVVEDAYDNADVFIMLSKPDGLHFEGFGMVFLEANIRGIPTIGPDGSGCKEAISDGVSGYVVDPENPEEVAQRLKWVLEEGKIDRGDCVRWAKQHSIEKQIESYEAAYAGIV